MNILKYPDDKLRVKCIPVDKVTPELVELGREMYKVMKENGGIGLAANQVGLDIRLVVMNDNGNPLLMFNPVVVKQSTNKIRDKEACLSFPGEVIECARPAEVSVKFRNIHNKMEYRQFEGIMARCVLHETEHLQGILLVDHKK